MRVGRYELVRRLARGELTELWLARMTGAAEFERYVLVKQVREDRTSDQVFVQSFMTEARVAGALHHHNIVQVQDIGEADRHYYLTMEYVHGESLRRVLARLHERKELMPLQHVLTIVSAVASALHYAHEVCGADKRPAGIVHRAVTPGNIIIGYDGNVKVMDFGIAKAALHTADGTLLASKVPYMAPEECTGQVVDRRADVFALGIVLHEAATGRRLFKGDSQFLTMSAIAHGVVPRASQHRKEISQPLEAVIAKALARVPAERYQTADDLRSALEPIATKLATGTMPSALASYMKQLFGNRQEPWHDTEAPVEAPIDFDGKANGLAAPPASAVDSFALPTGTETNAPLTKARTRAITGNPTFAATPVGVGDFTAVDVKLPPEPAHEPTAVVPPLPVAGQARPPRRHARLIWIASSALVAVACVIVFLSVTASPSPASPSTPVETDHAKPMPPKHPAPEPAPAATPSERTWASTEAAKAAAPPPAPEPAPPPAPTPEPTADPAPAPPPPAPEPTAEPEPAQVAAPAPKHAPAHHKSKPVAKSHKPAVKPTSRPAEPKNWDPDSLFYGKKP